MEGANKTSETLDLIQKELKRSLKDMGYEFVQNDKSSMNIYLNKEEIATINEDGSMAYKTQYESNAAEIYDLRQEIGAYIKAYQTAKATENVTDSGYGIVMDWNNHVLAAKDLSEYGFQFVTWEKDVTDNGYSLGHYYDNFSQAKEDFITRSGMLNKDRIFSETELKVIRSGLVKVAELDPNMTFEQEQAVKAIVDRIDTLLVPKIEEHSQEHKENGWETDMEL